MSTIFADSPQVFDVQALRWQLTEERVHRKRRQREAAQALGITEAQAVDCWVGQGATLTGQAATALTSPAAVRLQGPFPALIESLEPAGPMMALTRNESVVHEKTGVYRNASHSGHMGLVLDEAIDLRLFYDRWAHGYWVEEPHDQGVTTSLQFFDSEGTAVHKIYTRAATQVQALEQIVSRFISPDQEPHELAIESIPPANTVPDDDVDQLSFQNEWLQMTDTHQFFGLLRRHQVGRVQALRLAPNDYAKSLSNEATRTMLEKASAFRVPIMVFVSNKGCIQIHSGMVTRVEMMGPWLNVLDPDFNLHLRADHIAQSWLVRKPTADGMVTSLEVFDAQGETLAYFFGKRKPGVPEDSGWRALVEALQ
jgi:putative hemin transport protein